MKETFAEEFRWVARCYLRVFLAPFVGAVREVLKELKRYDDEFEERFGPDVRARNK